MNTQPLALDGNSGLGVAIILGLILGFTLVKADFTWEKSCVRFFTLKSGRLIKIALMTVAFATVGFYFAARYGLVHINAVPTYLYSVILGGVLSGIGFAAAGIMPASAIAGTGSRSGGFRPYQYCVDYRRWSRGRNYHRSGSAPGK